MGEILKRIQYDWQYIVLNRVTSQIPSWTIRRCIYRKYGMDIERGARIGIGTVVLNPRAIKIGERSIINENCMLDGRGGLVIGEDSSISSGTRILSASHHKNSDSFQYYTKKVFIGSHVWVGTGAIILDGSYIRDYSVIGAGAVIKGKTEKGDIWLGNPARLVKKRKNLKDYHLNYKAYFR